MVAWSWTDWSLTSTVPYYANSIQCQQFLIFGPNVLAAIQQKICEQMKITDAWHPSVGEVNVENLESLRFMLWGSPLQTTETNKSTPKKIEVPPEFETGKRMKKVSPFMHALVLMESQLWKVFCSSITTTLPQMNQNISTSKNTKIPDINPRCCGISLVITMTHCSEHVCTRWIKTNRRDIWQQWISEKRHRCRD